MSLAIYPKGGGGGGGGWGVGNSSQAVKTTLIVNTICCMIPHKFKAFQCQQGCIYMAVPIYSIWHSNSLHSQLTGLNELAGWFEQVYATGHVHVRHCGY